MTEVHQDAEFRVTRTEQGLQVIITPRSVCTKVRVSFLGISDGNFEVTASLRSNGSFKCNWQRNESDCFENTLKCADSIGIRQIPILATNTAWELCTMEVIAPAGYRWGNLSVFATAEVLTATGKWNTLGIASLGGTPGSHASVDEPSFNTTTS